MQLDASNPHLMFLEIFQGLEEMYSNAALNFCDSTCVASLIFIFEK